MTTESQRLASLLRDRRKTLRLTQEALAAKAGVSSGTIRRLEKGAAGEPYTLPQVLSALGLSLDGALNAAPPERDPERADRRRGPSDRRHPGHRNDNDVPRTFEEATERDDDGRVDLDRLEAYIDANRLRYGERYDVIKRQIASARYRWEQHVKMLVEDREQLVEAIQEAGHHEG